VPSLPSNHRTSTALMGVLLASFMSVGLAFGSEYLDPTFRTPDEVTSFLNIPVLAAMPREKKNGTSTYVS
jgi:capsular polysaccharide biosynthesis protein